MDEKLWLRDGCYSPVVPQLEGQSWVQGKAAVFVPLLSETGSESGGEASRQRSRPSNKEEGKLLA